MPVQSEEQNDLFINGLLLILGRKDRAPYVKIVSFKGNTDNFPSPIRTQLLTALWTTLPEFFLTTHKQLQSKPLTKHSFTSVYSFSSWKVHETRGKESPVHPHIFSTNSSCFYFFLLPPFPELYIQLFG
jgi:hypothetical protein